jgi:hypothetical protein
VVAGPIERPECRFQHHQERCCSYPGNWAANALARGLCGPTVAIRSSLAPRRRDERLPPSTRRTKQALYPSSRATSTRAQMNLRRTSASWARLWPGSMS